MSSAAAQTHRLQDGDRGTAARSGENRTGQGSAPVTAASDLSTLLPSAAMQMLASARQPSSDAAAPSGRAAVLTASWSGRATSFRSRFRLRLHLCHTCLRCHQSRCRRQSRRSPVQRHSPVPLYPHPRHPPHCRCALSDVDARAGARRPRDGPIQQSCMRCAVAPRRSSAYRGATGRAAPCLVNQTGHPWVAATMTRPLRRPRLSAPTQAPASARLPSYLQTAPRVPAAVITRTSSGRASNYQLHPLLRCDSRSPCCRRPPSRRHLQRRHLQSASLAAHSQMRDPPATSAAWALYSRRHAQ